MKNPLRRSRAAEIEQRSIAGASPMGGAGFLTDPAAIPPYPGYGRQIAGVPVNAESALQVPAVFAAIRVICFTLGKMGDPYACEQELSDDNIPYEVRLASQPPFLTDTFGASIGGPMNYDGRNRTVGSMALFGEAWWYAIEMDRLQRPQTVEVLNPLWLDIKEENGVTRYFYGLGSEKIELDPALLTHIPLLSAAGGMRGLSSIRYLGVMMGLALAALEFGSLFFAQGQHPSYLLQTDQNVSTEKANALIEKFLIQHAGLSQAHLPLLLDMGLKAVKQMATPDESQFNQTLTSANEAIAGWFGVPPYLMGIMTERGNAYGVGATEEMMRRMEQTCLAGYVTALEEAYTRKLPAGMLARFDTHRLVHPDAQAQSTLITALRQTQTASINDIRTRILKWAPLDDPAADDALAPLASNTAPEQTAPNKSASDAPESNNTPAQEGPR